MQGLQMLEQESWKNVLLATEAPTSKAGSTLTPIRYADDLTISSDGSIYFTDASDIPSAINEAGFYDTMASFILSAFQVARAAAISSIGCLRKRSFVCCESLTLRI